MTPWPRFQAVVNKRTFVCRLNCNDSYCANVTFSLSLPSSLLKLPNAKRSPSYQKAGSCSTRRHESSKKHAHFSIVTNFEYQRLFSCVLKGLTGGSQVQECFQRFLELLKARFNVARTKMITHHSIPPRLRTAKVGVTHYEHKASHVKAKLREYQKKTMKRHRNEVEIKDIWITQPRTIFSKIESPWGLRS